MRYIRAEIIGELPSGQKKVHLLAGNADGIHFYTEDKHILRVEDIVAGQWIPVEVEVPNFSPRKWRTVLVTMEDQKGNRFVTTAKYDEKHGIWNDFKYLRYYNYRVVAWMMKPQIYRGNRA